MTPELREYLQCEMFFDVNSSDVEFFLSKIRETKRLLRAYVIAARSIATEEQIAEALQVQQ